MNLVFFPEELNERAPLAMGVLAAPAGGWANVCDIFALLREGEPISIRQASDSEIKRAEQLVAIYEIGKELAARHTALLDAEPVEVQQACLTAMRDALEGIPNHGLQIPAVLLDKEGM